MWDNSLAIVVHLELFRTIPHFKKFQDKLHTLNYIVVYGSSHNVRFEHSIYVCLNC